MGTRADFYVGRGVDAQWLGSIAYDGYPDGTPELAIVAVTEEAFRAKVEHVLSTEESAKSAVFPNMKDRQNVAWDKRSGIMIIGGF